MSIGESGPQSAAHKAEQAEGSTVPVTTDPSILALRGMLLSMERANPGENLSPQEKAVNESLDTIRGVQAETEQSGLPWRSFEGGRQAQTGVITALQNQIEAVQPPETMEEIMAAADQNMAAFLARVGSGGLVSRVTH